jgi:hypothetical protein
VVAAKTKVEDCERAPSPRALFGVVEAEGPDGDAWDEVGAAAAALRVYHGTTVPEVVTV